MHWAWGVSVWGICQSVCLGVSDHEVVCLAGVCPGVVCPMRCLPRAVCQGGVCPTGVSACGCLTTKVSTQGVSAQGCLSTACLPNGASAQGLSARGLSVRGVSASGPGVCVWQTAPGQTPRWERGSRLRQAVKHSDRYENRPVMDVHCSGTRACISCT